MKNKKRFIAAVMALAMTAALTPTTAFADEHSLTEAGSRETSLNYRVNESFLVTIPMTVTLGDTATIKAENVNLKNGKSLNVTLSGTSEADNSFKLKTKDNDELDYTVTRESSEGEAVNVGVNVLTVPNTENGGTATLSFNAPASDSTLKAGDYNGSVTFTISVKTNTSGVAIDDKSKTALIKGETLDLTATVDDAATDKTITWKSSDDTVASVDSTGKVTANKTGSAIITVTATNGTADTSDDKTDTITITVTNPANGITLNKTTLALTKGSNETLTATVDPTDADGTVTWSSNNTSVATVDSNGKVTAVAKGSATITASIGGKSAECVVTVTNPANGITLNKTELDLTKGSNETLIATVDPTDADGTVSWSSSDDTVATVDSNGEVTAIAPGTATITATIGGKSATCSITVPSITVPVIWSGDVLTGFASTINFNGITLTSSSGDARNYNTFFDYGMNTFTAPEGKKFTKIEIVCTYYGGGWSGATSEKIGTYQPYPDDDPDYWRDIYTVTWTGDDSEVSFQSDIYDVQTITFTLG